MRYCVRCHRLLTMDELVAQLDGKCFGCFWPAPTADAHLLTHDAETDYWRSDEATGNE